MSGVDFFFSSCFFGGKRCEISVRLRRTLARGRGVLFGNAAGAERVRHRLRPDAGFGHLGNADVPEHHAGRHAEAAARGAPLERHLHPPDRLLAVGPH